MTHFHASIAGERASGKRSIVCWWSPVAYHFSATALRLFSSVRSMRPTVSPTCNPGPYSDPKTCKKCQMPLHNSELLLKRMLCMEAKELRRQLFNVPRKLELCGATFELFHGWCCCPHGKGMKSTPNICVCITIIDNHVYVGMYIVQVAFSLGL